MHSTYCVEDSGRRESFATGAVRDTREGKGRYDLISPLALARVARQMELGATKYGDRNWEKGMPCSRLWDSAVRHLQKFLAGERVEDHLAAACFNVMGIMHVQEMISRGRLPAALNDLPNFQPLCTGGCNAKAEGQSCCGGQSGGGAYGHPTAGGAPGAEGVQGAGAHYAR